MFLTIKVKSSVSDNFMYVQGRIYFYWEEWLKETSPSVINDHDALYFVKMYMMLVKSTLFFFMSFNSLNFLYQIVCFLLLLVSAPYSTRTNNVEWK